MAHLLKTTNAATPYSTLKVAILRLYSNAGGEDLETSLNDCVRDDDKVSNYLARLRSIIASRYCEPTTLQEDILKSRVLQSVDTPNRLALYSYEQSTVDKLAAHADRLLSLAKSQPATPMSKVNITSTKPHQELINEMLNSRMNRLDRAFAQFSTPPRFTSPPGSNAPINRLLNVAQPYRSLACWYHETYGNRATKCKSKPCPWAPPREIEPKNELSSSTN